MPPMKKEQKEVLQHPPYLDFASCPFEEVEQIRNPRIQHHAASTGNSTPNKPRSRGGAKITFPMRLHALLESLPRDETAITWQPHGRAFKVNDRVKFENEILPSFGFNYRCQYASFQRQLNIYSFMRIIQGPDKGAYYNCLFLRSRPDLCYLMRRKVSKKNGVRKIVDASTEPDFSRYPPMPENFAIATNNGFTMASIATKTSVFSSSGRVNSSSDFRNPFEATCPSITTATSEGKALPGSGYNTGAPLSTFGGAHLPIRLQDELVPNSSDDSKPAAVPQGTSNFAVDAADTASRLASNFPGLFSLEAATAACHSNALPNNFLLPPLNVGPDTTGSMTEPVGEDSSHAQYLQDVDLEYCPFYYKGYESGS